MKALLAAVLLLVVAQNSHALTDYQCVNDCTAKGYMYQLCNSRCTVPDAQPQFQPYQQLQPIQPMQPMQPMQPIQQPKQTDYQCLTNCTQAGYQYGFCQSKCSY